MRLTSSAASLSVGSRPSFLANTFQTVFGLSLRNWIVIFISSSIFGALYRTRTCNLRNRSSSLYPVELRALWIDRLNLYADGVSIVLFTARSNASLVALFHLLKFGSRLSRRATQQASLSPASFHTSCDKGCDAPSKFDGFTNSSVFKRRLVRLLNQSNHLFSAHCTDESWECVFANGACRVE